MYTAICFLYPWVVWRDAERHSAHIAAHRYGVGHRQIRPGDRFASMEKKNRYFLTYRVRRRDVEIPEVIADSALSKVIADFALLYSSNLTWVNVMNVKFSQHDKKLGRPGQIVFLSLYDDLWSLERTTI